MLFMTPKKLFSLWIFSNFCADIFGHLGKRINRKTKVNFKIDEVTNWETNNYNIDFAQYLKK